MDLCYDSSYSQYENSFEDGYSFEHNETFDQLCSLVNVFPKNTQNLLSSSYPTTNSHPFIANIVFSNIRIHLMNCNTKKNKSYQCVPKIEGQTPLRLILRTPGGTCMDVEDSNSLKTPNSYSTDNSKRILRDKIYCNKVKDLLTEVNKILPSKYHNRRRVQVINSLCDYIIDLHKNITNIIVSRRLSYDNIMTIVKNLVNQVINGNIQTAYWKEQFNKNNSCKNIVNLCTPNTKEESSIYSKMTYLTPSPIRVEKKSRLIYSEPTKIAWHTKVNQVLDNDDFPTCFNPSSKPPSKTNFKSKRSLFKNKPSDDNFKQKQELLNYQDKIMHNNYNCLFDDEIYEINHN